MKTNIALVTLLWGYFFPAGAAAVMPAAPWPVDPTKAQREAHERVEARMQRYRRVERLRKDLRYLSEELDRDIVEGHALDLSVYSRRGLARLRDIRAKGNVDPLLKPALKRLEDLYRGLPNKAYAETYAQSLVRHINETLRWASEKGTTDKEMLALLDEVLALPDDVPTETNGIAALGFFPVDIPFEEFMRLDPIRAFLVKHRLSRPSGGYQRTTPEDIVGNKHNVQIGVEVEGVVSRVDDCWFDLDVCFSIAGDLDLHVELPPSWRLLHRGIPLPKLGQRVRVRGWSYLDVFHKLELEYDPDHPFLGKGRKHLWEIHPINDIEILP